MKQFWLGLIIALTGSIPAWGVTATGMPALDELQADVIKNGALSKRLGFTEKQRKDIQNLIDTESKPLVKLRDALLVAEAKFEKAKKTKNKPAIVAARTEKETAAAVLQNARDQSFNKLSTLMTGAQFKDLKKWRAAGKANIR